jgi:hypothetical protein
MGKVGLTRNGGRRGVPKGKSRQDPTGRGTALGQHVAMGIDEKKLCGVGTRYMMENGGLSLSAGFKACQRS